MLRRPPSGAPPTSTPLLAVRTGFSSLAAGGSPNTRQKRSVSSAPVDGWQQQVFSVMLPLETSPLSCPQYMRRGQAPAHLLTQQTSHLEMWPCVAPCLGALSAPPPGVMPIAGQQLELSSAIPAFQASFVALPPPDLTTGRQNSRCPLGLTTCSFSILHHSCYLQQFFHLSRTFTRLGYFHRHSWFLE